MLDARASLTLINSEISRYYHVAGLSQPADTESLSFSFHQFAQSVPVMGGNPLWIKAACRCACVLPDEWQSRLAAHSSRVSALLTPSAPRSRLGQTSDPAAVAPHPPSIPFKPNLASSLKATAERWKREGFDLFEKGRPTAAESSGSKSLEPQDVSAPGAADDSASGGSDRCSTIMQDVFDVLVGAAASSLYLDLRGEFIEGSTATGSSKQPGGFISSMLQLASACRCPVPMHSLSTACGAAYGASACVCWILHEVLLLNAADCVFVVRPSLLPRPPPTVNLTSLSLALAVHLGHSVAAWSASVESALVSDENFFRTQPSKVLAREEQCGTPSKTAQSSQPLEKLWFKLCASAVDSKHDLEPVLNSAAYSSFSLHSLLNCLASARLGGLLQQWLVKPACSMLLGSSEMSRLSTRRLWSHSHALGALPAAAALMSETKRVRASGASLPALLSLLAIANSYRLLNMCAFF
jgi:hypothetical protein